MGFLHAGKDRTWEGARHCKALPCSELVVEEERQRAVSTLLCLLKASCCLDSPSFGPTVQFGGSQRELKGQEERDNFLPWQNSSGSTSDETQAGDPASPCDPSPRRMVMILHIKPGVPLWPSETWPRMEVLCAALTRAPDRAHLWGLSDGPAAPGVAAALHLGVLARKVPGTAAPDQRRETRPNPLVCRARGQGATFTTSHHHAPGQLLSAHSQWCLFWLPNGPA